MVIDNKKEIQRIRVGDAFYVLVREQTYNQLLRRLDSLDTVLKLQRTRAESSINVVDLLLKRKFRPEEIETLFQAQTFGKRIELLRKFRGMDQIQLAARAGVSQTMISNLENDKLKRPSYEAVHKILQTLDVPDIISYSILRYEYA